MKNGRLLGNGVPRGGVGVLRRRVACCSPIEARLQETKESLFALSTLHCNLQRLTRDGMNQEEKYIRVQALCVFRVCVCGGVGVLHYKEVWIIPQLLHGQERGR